MGKPPVTKTPAKPVKRKSRDRSDSIPSQITVLLGEDGSARMMHLASLLEKRGQSVRKVSGGINSSAMIRSAVEYAIKAIESGTV